MKAYKVLEWLISLSDIKSNPTVDTIKEGNPDKEVKRVAVCFIATPDVIKAAYDWGADMLITHEPTYHDHYDAFVGNPVLLEKKRLIESTGMVVARYHDHAHTMNPDIIHYGFLNTLDLDFEITQRRMINLKNPITPYNLARLIEEKNGVKHVRIVGKTDFEASRLALFLGACGDISHIPLKDGLADISICGEVCEWKCCEYVRDASQLGRNMAMLILGHVGSERDGMKLVADKINNELGIEAKYLECGEVYSYTD